MAEASVVDRPSSTWGIYRRLIGAQARGQASYRASFWIDMIGSLVFLGADLAAILVIFSRVDLLGDFTSADTLLVFGLGASAFALADLFVGNIERLKNYVRTGLLDAVLIRPLGVLTQLLALDVGFRRLGRALSSVIILALTTVNAGVQWDPAKVALVVIAPLSGAAFFCAYFVATSTVAFWWVESGELANALTYGGREFTSYPISIYSGWFRRVVAYGLGFGFVSYYPALALLGRPDPLGGPAWLCWAGPLVAAAAWGVATLCWRTGVRHYRGTGS